MKLMVAILIVIAFLWLTREVDCAEEYEYFNDVVACLEAQNGEF
jgi:hypothetical protein